MTDKPMDGAGATLFVGGVWDGHWKTIDPIAPAIYAPVKNDYRWGLTSSVQIETYIVQRIGSMRVAVLDTMSDADLLAALVRGYKPSTEPTT